MTIQFPDELRSAVIAQPGVPVELVDQETHATYVLIPAAEFDRLKAISADDMGDTYEAQVESAMRAGWGHPLMDEYNDYDARDRQA